MRRPFGFPIAIAISLSIPLCAACTRVEIDPPLKAPARIAALSHVDRLTVQWDAVDGADGYVVYSALDPSIGPDTAVAIGSAATSDIPAHDLSAVITPVPAGQNTYIAVAARFGSTVGPALPAVAARPLAVPTLTSLTAHEDEGTSPSDFWGETLVAGDFDGDRRGDIVVGSGRAGGGNGRLEVNLGGGVDVALAAPIFGLGSAGVGTGVAAADFDHDGDDDLVIGAPGANGGDGEIRFHAGGPQIQDEGDLDATPSMEGFGCAVAAGDWDGDGDMDLGIGEVGATVGTIHLYRNLGIGAFGPTLFEPASTVNAPGAGSSASGCILDFADVDGDGYEDLLTGDPLSNLLTGDTDEGRVMIWFGGAGGIGGNPDVSFTHGNNGDRTGAFVAGVGHTDSDAREEFAVVLGSAFGPRVQIYAGRSRNDFEDDNLQNGDRNIDGVPRGAGQYDAMFAAAAGDLDGDGRGDVLVGDRRGESAPDADDDTGSLTLWFGAGGASVVESPLEIATGAVGDATGARATVSDLDGDGWPEIVVGEPGFDSVDANAGRFRAFRGGRIRGVEVDPGEPIAIYQGAVFVPRLATFRDPDPRPHVCELEFLGQTVTLDPCEPETMGVDAEIFTGAEAGEHDLRIRVLSPDGAFGEARVRVDVEALP